MQFLIEKMIGFCIYVLKGREVPLLRTVIRLFALRRSTVSDE